MQSGSVLVRGPTLVEPVELECPTVEVTSGATDFRIARQHLPWEVAPGDRFWFQWKHDPKSLAATKCSALEKEWAVFSYIERDLIWAPFPGENVLLDLKLWQQ